MSVLSDALKDLLASEQALNASAFTASQRTKLEQFARSTRLIEIGKQGAGTFYRLLNRKSVTDYLRMQQSLDDASLTVGLPARSRNIGRDRDSKKGQSGHDCCYLLMKAWDAKALWSNENDTMQPADLTRRFGVAALRIASGHAWRSNNPLLLVENQALFDRCDWLPGDFNGSLAYYAGQLSDVLLQWLSEQKRTGRVTLFPDYDGAGLSNYVRLAESIHPESTLQFYWLPDWETKLANFGNAGCWLKTRVQFENALNRLKAMNAMTEEFIRLGDLSQRCGKALEQESIWL